MRERCLLDLRAGYGDEQGRLVRRRMNLEEGVDADLTAFDEERDRAASEAESDGHDTQKHARLAASKAALRPPSSDCLQRRRCVVLSSPDAFLHQSSDTLERARRRGDRSAVLTFGWIQRCVTNTSQ